LSQTLNDWYDREIDAINEPYRPIPSGAISENEVIQSVNNVTSSGLQTVRGFKVFLCALPPLFFVLDDKIAY